ncbi:hypothetical protein AYO21_07101 [Fonsecaea monophora]|uniref:Cytochrome P450 n=1 Tax=Fonsecaea monophora TaxID=254056 RepID=A0A177F3D5_9EURO|nr:hypothetical protein AYO21_07101 [Fonsecaea monophora]OAG38748.1 hypothetical protein AYO21_07101 [Fonsecaea monophora]
MTITQQLLLFGLVGVGFALYYTLSRIGQRPPGLPPGPPTDPFWGNIKQFQKWAHEYGPIYSIKLGVQTMIVLSDGKVVKELIDKRSASTNERGPHYIAHDLLGNGQRILQMRYGPDWRLSRKLYHRLLTAAAAKTYLPYLELESKKMLYDLSTKPDGFLYHIKRYTNSMAMMVTYGRRVPEYDNPTMREILKSLEKTSSIIQVTSAALADAYPILQWVPAFLFPAKRKAIEHTKTEMSIYLRLWNQVKTAMAQGTQKPCFAADLVTLQKKEGFTDLRAAYVSSGSMEAGTGTSSNNLLGFIQALILFPEALKEAQRELDRVVGDGRLPDLSDRENLPYLRSCVKESLRWMPPVIVGIPHCLSCDETYMGYVLPKGAELLINVWTLNNDPVRFKDPRTFNPARFLKDEQTSFEAATNPDPDLRDHYAFGGGRRLCPGTHLADDILFLAMSKLVWAFDFKPAVINGKEVPPTPERFTQTAVVMPEPYPATIVPRSAKRAAMIKKEWEQARDSLLDDELQWREIPQGMKFTEL